MVSNKYLNLSEIAEVPGCWCIIVRGNDDKAYQRGSKESQPPSVMRYLDCQGSYLGGGCSNKRHLFAVFLERLYYRDAACQL